MKLAPGVYLSIEQSIVLRRPDVTGSSYAFKGFLPDASLPAIEANPELDKFLESIIQAHISSPKTPATLRTLLKNKMEVNPNTNANAH